MGRLIQVLIPIVLVTAAIAGCIGGEEEPEPINGNGNGNGDPGNGNETGNQTQEPAPVPVPHVSVEMAIGDNASQPAPFMAPIGSGVTFFLDGSGSTVDDGTIDVYVWSVVTPDGSEIRGAPGPDQEFSFNVNSTTNTQDYGVYAATLRVLSDQGEIAEMTELFALSVSTTRSWEGHLVGPAPTGCDWIRQGAASGALPHTEALPGGPLTMDGTYVLHSMSVGQNATALNINLSHSSDFPDSEVKIYVYAPGTDVEGGNCDGAAAESNQDASEVSVSIEGLEPGSYSIRVQMVGFTIGPYTMDMSVIYSVPGDDGADDGDDGDDGEEGDE